MSRDASADTAGLREEHRDGLMCQAETRDECDNPTHWTAQPDPTPEPDAGDVALTDADDVALAEWWVSEGGDHEDLALDSLTTTVERILANHVAAAREADRAEVERLQAKADYHHARADVLRAKLSTGVALRGGKPGDYWAEWHRTHCAAAQGATEERARAKAAEERLAGLVAKIEALADSLEAGRWPTRPRGGAVDDLRALIPADTATDEAT